MTITLAEYRKLEPTLRRPLTDTIPERLSGARVGTVTPVVAPSISDQERYQHRKYDRAHSRVAHREAVQRDLGFRWDLTVVRELLAAARATSRALRGVE